ncbi:hypothetical protein FGW37_05360 [Streptomyces rectiverticillatus]|uniref:hypothetical protein n=1 Tax=Streptomyces rectiverticillatus TaxID=173860 RepID=UPI0015C3BD03|nr:hypothetical protein [Streptomyces rectiverticillatus]QLE71106.1 hypothetical protein FGW37_05360 [Streptomyces rectiverticillatus]
MPSFVTVDDVAVRLGRSIPEDERPRVQAFIADVLALIQDFCGSGYRETAVIKALTCAEVVRWLAIQPGIVSEKVGDLEVTFGSTATAQSLSPASKAALTRYRPGLSSIPLTRG